MPDDPAGDPSPELARLRSRLATLEKRLADADAAQALASSLDSMLEGLQIIGFDWRYVYLNETAARHGRRERAELLNKTMVECYPGIDETDLFKVLERAMNERRRQHLENAFDYGDGTQAWFDLLIEPVPQGLLVLSIDISARKRAEDDLRASRDHMEATFSCMADGVVTTDLAGRVMAMNPSAERLIGWSLQEATGRPLSDLVKFLDQIKRTVLPDPASTVLRQGVVLGLANNTLLVDRNGRHIPIGSSGAPLRSRDGAVRGVVIVLRDMTKEYNLLAQLQQAQKMEAVGRLAGGIAHDFNNILSVIQSYGTFLTEDFPDNVNVRDNAAVILDAAGRAARLTSQLLTFSRRQVQRLTALNLNEIVGELDKMLRRLIGEDIELTTVLAPELGEVLADASQVEQIVMNLVVNARDAMLDGGKVTIETRNVEVDASYGATKGAVVSPGPYVMLAVSDTGVGMDKATQDRIFEPFFTTKGQGKGTGLGLSTLYGIVKQSNGFVWVYSEPGKGSTFKVYLPTLTDARVPKPTLRSPPVDLHGTETILLVEDDKDIRQAAARILSRHGYRLLQAEDGASGLALCERHGNAIDLLLTDVVMPGMNGRELARRAALLVPGLRVLYSSGYTDDTIVHHGVLEPGTMYLAKPFTPESLLRKVREALE